MKNFSSFYILLLNSFICNISISDCQIAFNKSYKLNYNNSSEINYLPNSINSILQTDLGIYAFGYSTDSTVKDVYGTGFYEFDLFGNLLNYNRIEYQGNYNYFFPDGICTFNGIDFYTGVNINNIEVSILKYNRITKQSNIFHIANKVCKNCYINGSNFDSDKQGNIYIASDIKLDTNLNSGNLVQLTRLNEDGLEAWNVILGDSIKNNKFTNYCNSVFIDENGYVYVGIGYTDQKLFKLILYKIDSSGNILGFYKSIFKEKMFNIYDITKLKNGNIILTSLITSDSGRPHYINLSLPIFVVLDSNLNFISNKIIGPRNFQGLGGFFFEKVVKSNNNDGFLLAGTTYENISKTRFDSTSMTIDTFITFVEKGILIKFNNNGDSLWQRTYTARNGEEDSYFFDFKNDINGAGYLVGGYSYLEGGYERYHEPNYMPWLLKIDNAGCFIPLCDSVLNNQNYGNGHRILFFPNPTIDFIKISFEESLIYSANLRIFNLAGQVIESTSISTGTHEFLINTTKWNSGIYIYSISFSDGKTATGKFVIE